MAESLSSSVGNVFEKKGAATPTSGLRRMTGSSKLRPAILKVEEEQICETPTRIAHPIRIRSSSSCASLNILAQKPPPNPLRRMRTPSTPIRLLPEDVNVKHFYTTDEQIKTKTLTSSKSFANFKEKPKIPPIRILVDSRTPGGTCSKASFQRKPVIPSLPKVKEDEKTPPNTMARTVSGSMLLRATPERLRRRSGSLTRLDPVEKSTPSSMKRKRTISLSDIGDGTPTRRRARTPSVSSSKRAKPEIRTRDSASQSPMKRFRSTVNVEQTANNRNPFDPSTWPSTTFERPPQLVCRSSSGQTYHSTSDEPIAEIESRPDEQQFLTPRTSLEQIGMVPQMKKQVSIDSGIPTEDDDDGWFGDSTKTIKKGQGMALARSFSMKFSPKNDGEEDRNELKAIENEKSCSTPALPTEPPLVRQSSTLSLRFKISPSTYLLPKPPTPPKFETVNPSTSHQLETPKKSALRSAGEKSLRNGRRRIRFSNISVFYFDRRQGESTVPSEGEVALDMHNEHHTERKFSLTSGRRPVLDLMLHNDEELSDGEVCGPDSDSDIDYSSARSISPMNQKIRIKILKKSGVKVEKMSSHSVESLRKNRTECGCTCENGVCLPETCQCALDGIQCQVDGEEYENGDVRLFPCQCFQETCTNPNGRIFYDPDVVNEYRRKTIAIWNAQMKTGIYGSPVVTKFADPDEDEEVSAKNSWMLKNAIPIKLETSPAKFPVTPVYTRRSRNSLSDIRESLSESQSLAERISAMQSLENDVCVEEEEEEESEEDPEETIRPVEEVTSPVKKVESTQANVSLVV